MHQHLFFYFQIMCRHYLCRCLLCAGLFILSPAAMPGDPHDRGVGVYIDQDLFAYGVNEDRDYTMGIGLEFFWQHEGLYPMDRLVGWLGSRFGLHADNIIAERSFILGFITYTPDNLAATGPVLDDRPYASLIYLGNKRIQADAHAALGIELQLGVLGTNIAPEVQRRLHAAWRDATNKSDPVDPAGWHHQISDGGEPTMRLRVSYSELLAESHGRWDLAGTTSVSVGYHTNASLEFALRGGKLASRFWTLPYDPINRGNFLPSLATNEWYVWAAYRAMAVGYDAMLQGQFRNSDVTFGSDDIRRLVHTAGLGLTLAYEPVRVTFSINAKTSELDVGAADRNHAWGGVYFVLGF